MGNEHPLDLNEGIRGEMRVKGSESIRIPDDEVLEEGRPLKGQ